MRYDPAVLTAAETTCRFCGDVAQPFEDCPSPEANGRPCLPIIDPSDYRWEICGRCRGEGTLRGFVGVYTEDDFASEIDIDEYLEHVRDCEDCSGSGKVRVVDQSPELDEIDIEFAEMRAIENMERRMEGA